MICKGHAKIACSLLLLEVRKINRFLEICHRDPQKILSVSTRDTRNSILDNYARIADEVSNRDCRLTLAWYCRSTSCSNIQPRRLGVSKTSYYYPNVMYFDMQEPCESRFCSFLLLEDRKINRSLEICH